MQVNSLRRRVIGVSYRLSDHFLPLKPRAAIQLLL